MDSHASTDATPNDSPSATPPDSTELQVGQRKRINSLLGYIILVLIASWVIWLALMIVDSLFGLGWFERPPTELPPR